MRLEVCIGAMKTQCANVGDHLGAQGINQDDIDWFNSNQRAWLGKDRPRAERIARAILYGATDAIGLGRMEITVGSCSSASLYLRWWM